MSEGNQNTVQSQSRNGASDQSRQQATPSDAQEALRQKQDAEDAQVAEYFSEQKAAHESRIVRKEIEDDLEDIPIGLDKAETDRRIEERDEFVGAYEAASPQIRKDLRQLSYAARMARTGARRSCR